MVGTEEQEVDHYQLLVDAIRNRIALVKAEHANSVITVTPDTFDLSKQQSNTPELRTCLIAATINAMRVLGDPNPPSENELVAELATTQSPSEAGELKIREIFEYLENKGYSIVNAWAYPEILVNGLLEGNCAIQIMPAKSSRNRSHATLLVGIKIDHGNIMLIEHDPDSQEPPVKEYPLDEQLDKLYLPEALTGLWVISKQPKSPELPTNPSQAIEKESTQY